MKLHLDNGFEWVVVKNAIENEIERMENDDYPKIHESDLEVLRELDEEMVEKCHYKKSE